MKNTPLSPHSFGQTEYNQAIIQRNQILGVIEKFEAFETMLDDLDIFTKYEHIASSFALPELKEQLTDNYEMLIKHFKAIERIIINSH